MKKRWVWIWVWKLHILTFVLPPFDSTLCSPSVSLRHTQIFNHIEDVGLVPLDSSRDTQFFNQIDDLGKIGGGGGN